eukprot:533149-Karenia_brevis.AAC.1
MKNETRTLYPTNVNLAIQFHGQVLLVELEGVHYVFIKDPILEAIRHPECCQTAPADSPLES